MRKGSSTHHLRSTSSSVMTNLQRQRRLSRGVLSASLAAFGVFCFVQSHALVHVHANALRAVQGVSVPLLESIPDLERRLRHISNQVEMAELSAATRVGSKEETVNVAILPDHLDYDRLIATVDIFLVHLERRGFLQDVSALTIQSPRQGPTEDLAARTISVSYTAHDEGLKQLFTLIHLTGLLTVGDALTPDERALLLEQTEEENPTGVVAIEHFLSIPLMSYVKDPRAHEKQLLKSFSSQQFEQTFKSMLQTSLLRDARLHLSDTIGQTLQKSDLWPTPFLMFESIELTKGAAEGWQRVEMEVTVFTREKLAS